MLRRTQKKVRYIYGAVLVLILLGSLTYFLYKPTMIMPDNMFLKDISLYQTHSKPNEKEKVLFSISWKEQLKKDSAGDKANFYVEQVIPNGREWLPVENGKKCEIDFTQYVYAPWVDTEEKRQKADPEKRDEKVTQLFVNITPKEEINDYFRVVVKNLESTDGSKKLETQESGIVQVNEFNKFIKR